MPSLTSTAEAAKKLKVTPRTIQRIAADYSIGQKVGRAIVFTEADISTLRGKIRGKSGNPNFVIGHTLGKTSKKIKNKGANPIVA